MTQSKAALPLLVLLACAGLLCAQPEDVQSEIGNSRQNAITRAAQAVSPAVASVIVTQVQVYTYDPFGGFGFDEFFRDFFPRRQYRQEVKSMGSGVVVSKDGEVITNAHVVRNASEIKVVLPDNRELEAELLGIDNNLDLALLKVKGKDLPVARLGTSEDLLIGEWAIAFGNPFGFLLQDAQPTVTVGVISALHRDVESGRKVVFNDMIQTDAAINPGNSGGPLCNAAGEVIGINTFIFTHSGGSEGIGFARPIDAVQQFIKDVKGTGATQYSRHKTGLGAVVADINSQLRVKFSLAHRQGVVVIEVEKESAAEAIGMQPGDVVLMAQGKVVRTAAGFQRQYEKVGSVVDIIIDRAGEQIRLHYRLSR